MKNKSPAFQFYPKDFLTDERVMLMSNETVGAYVKLLCYDWLNDGLPSSHLATFAGVLPDNQGWLKGGSNLVEGCFIAHPEKPGYVTNPRLQSEREKQRVWNEKSSAGGRKSAEVRKNQAKARRSGSKGGSHLVQTKRQPNVNSSSSSSSSSSDNSLTRVITRAREERRPKTGHEKNLDERGKLLELERQGKLK